MRISVGNAFARCTCMPIARYLLNSNNRMNERTHTHAYTLTHMCAKLLQYQQTKGERERVSERVGKGGEEAGQRTVRPDEKV